MKKCLKMLTSFVLLCVCIICLTGCDTRSKVIFYYADGSVFEEIWVNEGSKLSDINYSNAINYMPNAYDFIGWYSFGYFENNKPQFLSDFDISHDNYPIGTSSEFEYIALMEIKENGWNYSGNDTNAFVWDSGTYASPAINLFAGDNYIRFDKNISTESLKYCNVFVNGGNGNYIESLEIFDDMGFKLSDVDLTSNIWENRDQEISVTSSYILKINVTANFEAGIMIGSEIY